MTLQAQKQALETEINRYITLLSNLKQPPADYISHLHYFRGLVQFANQVEADSLWGDWQEVKPKDRRSLAYIEDGAILDSDSLVGRADITKSLESE